MFFSVMSQQLTMILLKNKYIDTSMQKDGIPGGLEHTGVVTQLTREAHKRERWPGWTWLMHMGPYHTSWSKLFIINTTYPVRSRLWIITTICTVVIIKSMLFSSAVSSENVLGHWCICCGESNWIKLYCHILYHCKSVLLKPSWEYTEAMQKQWQQ